MTLYINVGHCFSDIYGQIIVGHCLSDIYGQVSGVDKAAYCVFTRKFSASTLENLS